MKTVYYEDLLNLASEYAKIMSGCTKVSVGSVIIRPNGDIVSFGANRTMPNTCKSEGCHRTLLYGNNDKSHRLPHECLALHSEIDAISHAGEQLYGATIIVTRYPCEACARAIASAGIGVVVYGRKQVISDMTKQIFKDHDILVVQIPEYDEEDVTN